MSRNTSILKYFRALKVEIKNFIDAAIAHNRMRKAKKKEDKNWEDKSGHDKFINYILADEDNEKIIGLFANAINDIHFSKMTAPYWTKCLSHATPYHLFKNVPEQVQLIFRNDKFNEIISLLTDYLEPEQEPDEAIKKALQSGIQLKIVTLLNAFLVKQKATAIAEPKAKRETVSRDKQNDNKRIAFLEG